MFGPHQVTWADGFVFPEFAVAGGYLWLNGIIQGDLVYYDILFRVDASGNVQQVIPPNYSFWGGGGIPGGIAIGSDGNVWANYSDIGVYILLPIVVKPYAVTMTHGSSVTLSQDAVKNCGAFRIERVSLTGDPFAAMMKLEGVTYLIRRWSIGTGARH